MAERKTGGSIVADPEAKAIGAVLKALEPLDEESRRRVLDYFNARWPAPSQARQCHAVPLTPTENRP